jgi:hypothetical protein
MVKPEKVSILLHSCRTGAGFEKGSYGKHLKGSLIISTTPTSQELGCTDVIADCIKECLAEKLTVTWADFAKCLKHCMGKKHEDEAQKEKEKGTDDNVGSESRQRKIHEPRFGKPTE